MSTCSLRSGTSFIVLAEGCNLCWLAAPLHRYDRGYTYDCKEKVARALDVVQVRRAVGSSLQRWASDRAGVRLHVRIT